MRCEFAPLADRPAALRLPTPERRRARSRGPFGSGASRARTGDLLHAMQALSQLSYSPESVRSRHLNTTSLGVPRRSDAEVEGAAAMEVVQTEEVRLPGVGAPHRDRVDIRRVVPAAHVAVRRVAAAHQADLDHVALAARPLAL